MAAAAEVVAFALGGLSTMPAVRNFSICAALSVAIDFALQVRFNPFCTGLKAGQKVRGQKRLAKRLQGCVSVTNARLFTFKMNICIPPHSLIIPLMRSLESTADCQLTS